MKPYIKKFKESEYDIVSYDQIFEDIVNKEAAWITWYTMEPSRLDMKSVKIKPTYGKGLSLTSNNFIFETGGEKDILKCEIDYFPRNKIYMITYKTKNMLKLQLQ